MSWMDAGTDRATALIHEGPFSSSGDSKTHSLFFIVLLSFFLLFVPDSGFWSWVTNSWYIVVLLGCLVPDLDIHLHFQHAFHYRRGICCRYTTRWQCCFCTGAGYIECWRVEMF